MNWAAIYDWADLTCRLCTEFICGLYVGGWLITAGAYAWWLLA